jgi:hypothetical protein
VVQEDPKHAVFSLQFAARDSQARFHPGPIIPGSPDLSALLAVPQIGAIGQTEGSLGLGINPAVPMSWNVDGERHLPRAVHW